MNYFYSFAIIILFVGIILYVERILKEKQRVNINNVDNKKTLEELKEIINFYCESTYFNRLLPLFNNDGYRKSDQNNIGIIINDDSLNKMVVECSQEILEVLSDNFKEKVFLFIDREKFEEFVINIVNDTLTRLSLNLNEKTINKIKRN